MERFLIQNGRIILKMEKQNCYNHPEHSTIVQCEKCGICICPECDEGFYPSISDEDEKPQVKDFCIDCLPVPESRKNHYCF